MTAFNSWLKRLAIRRSIVPDRLYWVVFAVLVLCAAALRAFWIYVLQIPYVMPDTYSYVSPLKEHWLLPLSEYRTSGTAMFIATALSIFRNPAGTLILNGILAVGSAALLAVAIKTVLKQNVLSLVVLFMVAFTAKNISLEYYLMSEHYARILYVVYAALLLWFFGNPRRLWMAVLIGLCVTLNILVKPSAVILIVATFIAFAAVAWISTKQRRQIAAAAAVFMATCAIALLGYMLVFQARFGSFAMTHFEGFNLFSHVGHLTVLDGGKHPDLKQRLKPLISRYVENYADKGNYRPNWLVYGSSSEELDRDFGDSSPARTIREYVFERTGSRDVRRINEIYTDLAIEGILAHPKEYLRYAADRAFILWNHGLTFPYYVVLPSAETLQSHRNDRATQRKWYYGLYGQPVPPCDAGPTVPASATGPLAALFHGPITSCAGLPYEEPSIRKDIERVDRIYHAVTDPVSDRFRGLARAGIVAAVIAALIWLCLRGRRILNLYAFGLLLVMVLFGYTVLHGLVNVAEAQRMTANVQDYVAVASCVFVLCAALSVQRLLLYVISLRRRRN